MGTYHPEPWIKENCKMKVKLLTPIEGFEDVAEYRIPKDGEFFYWEAVGKVVAFERKTHAWRAWLVLSPVKRWREATIDDVVRAIKGEKVVARFRDADKQDWHGSELNGYVRGRTHNWASIKNTWAQCEVLDA